MARQIPAVPGGSAAPGTYTITAASLEETLHSSGNDRTETENAIVRINSRQIEIGLDAQGQDAMYTGVPVAVDGELRMDEMQSTSRVLEFILSPSDLGEAIADPAQRLPRHQRPAAGEHRTAGRPTATDHRRSLTHDARRATVALHLPGGIAPGRSRSRR